MLWILPLLNFKKIGGPCKRRPRVFETMIMTTVMATTMIDHHWGWWWWRWCRRCPCCRRKAHNGWSLVAMGCLQISPTTACKTSLIDIFKIYILEYKYQNDIETSKAPLIVSNSYLKRYPPHQGLEWTKTRKGWYSYYWKPRWVFPFFRAGIW